MSYTTCPGCGTEVDQFDVESRRYGTDDEIKRRLAIIAEADDDVCIDGVDYDDDGFQRLNQWEALARDLRAVTHSDDLDQFAALVERACSFMEMTDGDLASEFKVSRPTVNRWRHGHSAPQRFLRGVVLEYLASQASAKARRPWNRESASGAGVRNPSEPPPPHGVKSRIIAVVSQFEKLDGA